jgi:hypothetical protein
MELEKICRGRHAYTNRGGSAEMGKVRDWMITAM